MAAVNDPVMLAALAYLENRINEANVRFEEIAQQTKITYEGLENKLKDWTDQSSKRTDALEVKVQDAENHFKALKQKTDGLEIKMQDAELKFNGLLQNTRDVERKFAIIEQTTLDLQGKVGQGVQGHSQHSDTIDNISARFKALETLIGKLPTESSTTGGGKSIQSRHPKNLADNRAFESAGTLKDGGEYVKWAEKLVSIAECINRHYEKVFKILDDLKDGEEPDLAHFSDLILDDDLSDEYIEEMSRQLYMLCILKTEGGPLQTVQNCKKLGSMRGMIAWNRVRTSLRGQNVNKSRDLSDQVHNVTQATTIEAVYAAIERWESRVVEFQTDSHSKVADSTKEVCLRKIAPDDLRRDLDKMAVSGYEQVRAYMIRRSQMKMGERSAKPQVANKNVEYKPAKPMDVDYAGEQDWDDVEDERGWDDEVNFAGKGFQGRCFNCQRVGHRAAECKQPPSKGAGKDRKGDSKGGKAGKSGKGGKNGKSGSFKGGQYSDQSWNQYWNPGFSGKGKGLHCTDESAWKGAEELVAFGVFQEGPEVNEHPASNQEENEMHLVNKGTGFPKLDQWQTASVRKNRQKMPRAKNFTKFEHVAKEQEGANHGSSRSNNSFSVLEDAKTDMFDFVLVEDVVDWDDSASVSNRCIETGEQQQQRRRKNVHVTATSEKWQDNAMARESTTSLLPDVAVESVDLLEFATNDEIHNVTGDGKKWRLKKSVIDSGAAESVAPRAFCPHVPVVPSLGSQRGQVYHCANGSKLANEGQRTIRGYTNEGCASAMNFQVAGVTRALSSVSQICDRGNKVVFDADGGFVYNSATGSKTHFSRENNIYVLNFWVEEMENEAAGRNVRFQDQSQGAEDASGFGRQVK